MHAPLGVPERQLVCSDLITALNECHAQGILYKWSGACNKEKQALTMCLRKERLDRTTRNREEAKERTAKKKEAWAEWDREIGGNKEQIMEKEGYVLTIAHTYTDRAREAL